MKNKNKTKTKEQKIIQLNKKFDKIQKDEWDTWKRHLNIEAYKRELAAINNGK